MYSPTHIAVVVFVAVFLGIRGSLINHAFSILPVLDASYDRMYIQTFQCEYYAHNNMKCQSNYHVQRNENMQD